MSSRRNLTLHACVKNVRASSDTAYAEKNYRFLNSMTQLNIVLCTIEHFYLRYSTSMDVRDPAPLLTIEKSMSYTDVQKPFLT